MEKHKRGRVTFNVKKFMNISLVIKESLRVENGTQDTNYQMNKISHKDKYYQKIGHNTSL